VISSIKPSTLSRCLLYRLYLQITHTCKKYKIIIIIIITTTTTTTTTTIDYVILLPVMAPCIVYFDIEML